LARRAAPERHCEKANDVARMERSVIRGGRSRISALRASIRATNQALERDHFDAESFDSSAIASCTVVMNWAGKMMVEFFSTEISAMVCSVRS